MGRLSTVLVDSLLDSAFGASVYTAPVTVYIGLSLTVPTDSGGNITEPVGNNYARVAVGNTLSNWPGSAGRGKSNGAPIVFPVPSGIWGLATNFVIMDAASVGTMLAWGDLLPSQAIPTGVIVNFPAGGLTISAPA